MPNPTREQIHNSIKGEAHCCQGFVDPETMRQVVLDGGASREIAEQTARFWEEENRKNGYTLVTAQPSVGALHASDQESLVG